MQSHFIKALWNKYRLKSILILAKLKKSSLSIEFFVAKCCSNLRKTKSRNPFIKFKLK